MYGLTCGGLPSRRTFAIVFNRGIVQFRTSIEKQNVHNGSIICHSGFIQITFELKKKKIKEVNSYEEVNQYIAARWKVIVTEKVFF